MINQVTLVGRLTKDVDLRYTASGKAVAGFTLAVNDGDDCDFIACVVWEKIAEATANFTRKGSMVGITGKVKTRSYEREGAKTYVTEVVCHSVKFLEPKKQETNEPVVKDFSHPANI
jgi:single-strand DNA-binding protein